MKGILALFLVGALIVGMGGSATDDNDGRAGAPPVGVHNPDHDCDLATAQAILRGEYGGSFTANAALCRVTWQDGRYLLICQDGRPRTLFRCSDRQYVKRSIATHKEVPVSADEARGILGWSIEALLLIAMVVMLVWVKLTSASPQHA